MLILFIALSRSFFSVCAHKDTHTELQGHRINREYLSCWSILVLQSCLLLGQPSCTSLLFTFSANISIVKNLSFTRKIVLTLLISCGCLGTQGSVDHGEWLASPVTFEALRDYFPPAPSPKASGTPLSFSYPCKFGSSLQRPSPCTHRPITSPSLPGTVPQAKPPVFSQWIVGAPV